VVALVWGDSCLALKIMPITGCPTKRAADGWESARFLGFFCASAVSRFQAFSSPAAANASRWAANGVA